MNQRQNITNVNVFYSTPSCYLYSLYKANEKWPVMKDDFLPYASREHTYWTGFYTSRPALKRFVRTSSNFLQSIRQLVSFTNLNDNQTKSTVNSLERAMGVAQHHDAVSGTENQHVANDYSKRLASATIDCVNLLPKVLSGILNVSLTNPLFYCPLLNISECLPIENSKNIQVIIYNPLASKVSSWIRVPLLTNDYVLMETKEFDIVPIEASTKIIPERKSNANYELVFNADLPALGFKIYNLRKSSTLKKLVKKKENQQVKDDKSFENEFLKLTFDESGNLIMVRNKKSQLDLTVYSQNYCYYKSRVGDNKRGK